MGSVREAPFLGFRLLDPTNYFSVHSQPGIKESTRTRRRNDDNALARGASSLHFLAASVLVASRAASCAELDSCSVEQFMDAADIVSLCCESAPGLCRETFPTTCSHTCARTIVPYMDRCGSMVESMSDAVFAHFPLS